MHPKKQPRAIWLAACFLADTSDFLRGRDHSFENERKRHLFRVVELLHDLLRMRGNLSKRFLTVKMLASGDIPNFGCCEIFHFAWGLCSRLADLPAFSFMCMSSSTTPGMSADLLMPPKASRSLR